MLAVFGFEPDKDKYDTQESAPLSHVLEVELSATNRKEG